MCQSYNNNKDVNNNNNDNHTVASAGTATEGKRTIIRKTTKFIFPKQKIDGFVRDLETVLPISPFKTGVGEFKNGVNRVQNSSVYFDSDDLAMYTQRVYKTDKADLFRTRWYGKEPTNESYFLERKRHRDTPLTGKESTKKRTLMNSQPEDKDWDNFHKFQTKISNLNLKPKVQTDYYRTSFMSTSMEGVRVTLDENVKVSDPNLPVNQRTYHEFSYAIIEVKISVQQGEEKKNPEWLVEMIKEHNGKKLKV
eukprot:Pgem_evm1s15965